MSPPAAAPAPLPKLSLGWERLCQDRSLHGRDWSAAAAELADGWLRALFARAVAEVGPPPALSPGRLSGLRARWRAAETTTSNAATGPDRGLALIAVGSLGRGDLAPGSDLDLLLVHSGRTDVTEVADRLWYPIWDDPMPLDHSVRTLAQVTQAAEADLRVALGLLEARLVAGDPELGARVAQLGRRLWQAHTPRWLPQVLAAREAAQRSHGEVAFLVEPELQQARGGLRDVQVLALLAQFTPISAGAASELPLTAAADLLHATRVELQRLSRRRSEKLLLEDRDAVAAALGMSGREELAHRLADAGRTVAWAVEDGSRRVQSWLAGPRGRGGSADRPIEPGLVLRDDEVVVPLATPVRDHPSLALRAAAASAELGVPLARSTLARLALEAPAPEPPWPEEVLRAFLRLLADAPASIHAIETLDQLGVWERFMPEWPKVRNRPQFDPYHRFTVDRHLLETVANVAARARDVHRPDLLLLAALLHDVGKGSGEDHSRAGAAMAALASERFGLAGPDAATLDKLVRHHLLLADTATRRDIEDPATAKTVADTVGDAKTLELLAALTEADGRATGPSAWSEWKAHLVERLAERAGALLEGKPLDESASFPTEDHRRLMANGGLQVVPGPRELVVVAPDRPGLLSDITGALALHGIAVLQARAHSEEGQALEVLTLDLPDGAAPRWERLAGDIQGAALGHLEIAAALARSELQRAGRRRRRSPALPPQEVKVTVDNQGASAATILEVRAPDAPGLLHRVAAVLTGLGLDIVSARVSTLANAAVDTFYVRQAGDKLPLAHAEAARQALEAELGARMRGPAQAGESRNAPET